MMMIYIYKYMAGSPEDMKQKKTYPTRNHIAICMYLAGSDLTEARSAAIGREWVELGCLESFSAFFLFVH